MGVIQYWDALRKEGLVKHLSAEKGDDRQIAENVDKQVLAVDLSVWLLQAGLQQDRQIHFGPTQSALKLCFERIINWLRYGCIPVAVLEGKSPPEKLELLQKRFRDRYPDSGGYQGNGGNASFQAFCRKIAGVFEAMGLPVVQAPGEAEAMCAALNAAGLVQGVATKDSDALLMGAQTVYHTVELHARNAKKSEVAYCDVADVRKHLGLSSGGGAALLTLAELMGGDYHVGGAAKVGPVGAWGVVQLLLKDKQDDSDILERLQAALKEDIQEEDIPDKCTGCKRCGHDSNNKTSTKKHSRKNPCSCCQPSPEDLDGGFFCCQKDISAPCQCRFHTCKLERNLAKVLRRAKETPGFVRKAEEALEAYRNQMAEAAKAVLELKGRSEQLTWMRRPSPDTVHAVLSQMGGPQGLEWSRRDVDRKLRPLLRTWDVQHPNQEGVEYRPVKIQKLHGAKGFEASGREWAYLLEWSKNGQADLEDDDEDGADDEEGEPKDAAEPAASRKVKKSAAGTHWARFVRMSVVQEHWQPLVKQFDAAVQLFKAKKSKQLAAKDARQAKKAGSVRLDAGQTTMHRFMQSKKLLDSGAAPASAVASTLCKAADAPGLAQQQEGADLGPGCSEEGRETLNPTQGCRPREAAVMDSGPLSGSAGPGEAVKRGAEGLAAGWSGQRGLAGGPSGSRQGVQRGAARADADGGAVPDVCSEVHILSNSELQDEPDVPRPAEGVGELEQRRQAVADCDQCSPIRDGLMQQFEGSEGAPWRSMDRGAPDDSGGYGAAWDSEDAYCGISPMASPSPEPVEDTAPRGPMASLEPQPRSLSSCAGSPCEALEEEQFHTPRGRVAEQAGMWSPAQAPATDPVPLNTAQLPSPKRARTPESPSCSAQEAQASPTVSPSGEGGASPAKRPREPVHRVSRPLAMRALSGPAPPETPARIGHTQHRSQPAVSLGEEEPAVSLKEEEPAGLQQHATGCTRTSNPGPDESLGFGAGSQLHAASRPARSRSRSGTSLLGVVEANSQVCRRSQRQAVPTGRGHAQRGNALQGEAVDLVVVERASHGSGNCGWQTAGVSAEIKPVVTPWPQQRRSRLNAGASSAVILLSSSPDTVDLTQDSPPIDLTGF